MASSRQATSTVERRSGPPMSCVWDIGMIPARLRSPGVALRPTRLFIAAGTRIDPTVSVPRLAAAKLAATAEAEAPLDPQGLQSRAYGFRVRPKRDPAVR